MDCIKPGARGWHDTNSKNYLLVYVFINKYACVLYISQVVFLQLECTCHLLFGPSNVFDVCEKPAQFAHASRSKKQMTYT